MKLLHLKVENFQGLKAAEFDFGGKSASIYADNGRGKTTLFSAFTWLLFDKSSVGAKGYNPKTKGPDGDLHHLDHAAEAVLQLADGRRLTLRKVFKEVYTKKRGATTEDFSGHATEYFVDSVPTSEKDYNTTLDSLFGGRERMQLLTQPEYFAEILPWESRRKILLEICGDVADADIIASEPALKELPNLLLMPGTTDQRYTVDAYRSVAASQKATINKELANIPARIDEATRATPDIKGLHPITVSRTIAELTDARKALQKRRDSMTATDATQATRARVAGLELELAEARAAYLAHTARVVEIAAATINTLTTAQAKLRTAMQTDIHALQIVEQRIERMTELRQQLLAEHRQVQGEAWDTAQEVCPSCEQSLPTDKVVALREAFNLRKSQRLEALVKRGQQEASKQMMTDLSLDAERLSDNIKATAISISEMDNKIANAEKENPAPMPFELTMKYKLLTGDIEKARQSEDKLDAASVDAEIVNVENSLREQEVNFAKFAQVEAQAKRVEELKAREKELAKQFENIEQVLYLCELFIKTKVAMLTSLINNKFQNVRFQLFVEQVNGGVKDVCEVLVPSDAGNLVPFAIANGGGRINAGLEIIDTLSRHWKQSLPVWVDNAVTVTRLYPVQTQVIRLVTAEADKVLRLEVQ